MKLGKIFWLLTALAGLALIVMLLRQRDSKPSVKLPTGEPPLAFSPPYLVVEPKTRLEPSGDPSVDCKDWENTANVYGSPTNKGYYLTFADCDYDGKWDKYLVDGGAREFEAAASQEEVIKKTAERLRLLAERKAIVGERMGNKVVRYNSTLNGTQDVCVPIVDDPGQELCGDDRYVARNSDLDRQFQSELDAFKRRLK